MLLKAKNAYRTLHRAFLRIFSGAPRPVSVTKLQVPSPPDTGTDCDKPIIAGDLWTNLTVEVPHTTS